MATPLSFHQERETKRTSSAQIARRLLANDTTPGTTDAEVVAVGLRKTCARVSGTLRNSLGVDGCNALLVRALTRTEAAHPLIRELRRNSDGGVSFDVLVTSVDVHGVGPVTAAIEALLAALVDILIRLIGEDMTVRLTTAEATPPSSGNGEGGRA